MSDDSTQFRWTFLQPRYWGIWLIVGLLWLIVQLPYVWQLPIGRSLGRLFLRLSQKRRYPIAATNIRLCFPELNAQQQTELLQQHFENLGITLIETAFAWWGCAKRLKPLGRVEGLSHLEAALAQDKGVILFSAHYTTLEIGLRFSVMQALIHFAYRAHENPLLDYLIISNRNRHSGGGIRRDNIRQMIKALRQNKAVWFAPDQNSGEGIFAPFFGVMAATNTATVRLAKMTGATIVPYSSRRLANNQGYVVEFLPALDNFPSDDTFVDVSRLNKIIETAVRQAPEQYLWVHRRFKDRPDGEDRFY